MSDQEIKNMLSEEVIQNRMKWCLEDSGMTTTLGIEVLESHSAQATLIDQQAQEIGALRNQLTLEACKNAENTLAKTRLELAVKETEEVREFWKGVTQDQAKEYLMANENQLNLAVQALEWYAGDEKYGQVRIYPPIPNIPILYDCGSLAQSTLDQIRRGENE